MTNELIMEYSNYIHALTHYFEGYKNKEDLYQVGCIGLIMAYQNFDSSKGVKFTSYAHPYILGEMCKLIRQDKTVKVSRDISKLKLKIAKASCLLSQKLMREPTTYELASFLEVPEQNIIDCLKINNFIQSLDEPINDDGKEINLYDSVASDNVDLNMFIALKDELSNLSDLERKIIEGRYIYNYTQSELADKLGMSQVQVSRSEQKIKKKIKEELVV